MICLTDYVVHFLLGKVQRDIIRVDRVRRSKVPFISSSGGLLLRYSVAILPAAVWQPGCPSTYLEHPWKHVLKSWLNKEHPPTGTNVKPTWHKCSPTTNLACFTWTWIWIIQKKRHTLWWIGYNYILHLKINFNQGQSKISFFIAVLGIWYLRARSGEGVIY